MRQAVTHHGVELVERFVVEIWKRLATVKCESCEGRIQVAYPEGEHCKRSDDHNYHPCTKFFDNAWNQQSQDLNTAISTLRLLTTKPERQDRLAYSRPQIIDANVKPPQK